MIDVCARKLTLIRSTANAGNTVERMEWGEEQIFMIEEAWGPVNKKARRLDTGPEDILTVQARRRLAIRAAKLRPPNNARASVEGSGMASTSTPAERMETNVLAPAI